MIQGISEAAQTISFPAMAERQQELAKVILQDPAVESLSSFIGIDGTNTTLNSGRILINLKPLEERKISATDVIRRLQPELAEVAGITLFMQPVQDLTVEDRVSRTQFQYTLEDPNADELNTYAPQMLAKLQELPELRDVASDQQEQGLRAKLVYRPRHRRRAWASRPPAIDQTLYDAFGQRQVSTMFTQLNQYHVVLEVMPGVPAESAGPAQSVHPHRRAGPRRHAAGLVSGGLAAATRRQLAAPLPARRIAAQLRQRHRILDRVSQRRPGSAQRLHPRGTTHRADHGQSPGPVSGGHAFLQPGARRFAGRRRRRREQGARTRSGCRASIQAEFQGTAAGVPGFAGERAGADSGGAGHGLHRARRAVRKLHSSRSRFSPRCPRPAWARCWR